MHARSKFSVDKTFHVVAALSAGLIGGRIRMAGLSASPAATHLSPLSGTRVALASPA